MAQIEYQRLTRTRARSMFAIAFVSRGSLWLAADHLLCVESTGYTENYKRFYFRDIQSFTLQKTGEGAVINFVLSIVIFLFAVGALLTQGFGIKIFLLIFAGFFGVLLLVNLLLGATCRCYLRTAVQVEQLPSLARVRKAQKIFARLHPLIAAAQGGELSPQTIAELVGQPEAQATTSQAVPGADESNTPSTLQ
jgi:hypothetical protein